MRRRSRGSSKVSHLLEGSVPQGRRPGSDHRAADRRRDGRATVWAERYDRDLHDIFALQDEISQAIGRGAAG
jgi:adenylate cyclase